MAINLLGSDEPKKKKQAEVPVEYHVPKEESAKKHKVTQHIEKKKKEREVKKQQKEQKRERRVNFAAAFASQAVMRRLRFVLLFVIIIVLLGAGGYVGYILLSTQSISEPEAVQQIPEETSQATAPVSATPVRETTPAVTQEITLPDTLLAPLRGALVRFQGDPTIYLVEENGELRNVVLQTVVFDNGQRISEIDLSLIYLLNESWSTIRRGQQVMGRVDWDPRVLTPSELQPFL